MSTDSHDRQTVFGPWVSYGARTSGCPRDARRCKCDDQPIYPLLAQVDRLYYAAAAGFAASVVIAVLTN